MATIRHVLLVAALLSLGAIPDAIAQHTVVYNNGSALWSSGVSYGSTEYTADDFQLPADGSVLAVRFFAFNTTEPTLPSDIDWFILADNGGQPGNQVAAGQAQNVVITPNGVVSGWHRFIVDFELGTRVSLYGGARYWLGLHNRTWSTFIAWSRSAQQNGSFAGRYDFLPNPGWHPVSIDLSFALYGDFCGPLAQNSYGTLLFAPFCTRDASVLAEDVYSTRSLPINRRIHDRLYLSSNGNRFEALAADDAVHVNGLDSGLGPYVFQPGVPPFQIDVPITRNLVPEAPQEITTLLPLGKSTVLFQLLDTQRTIYGNTAVYLVADCGIYLEKAPVSSINFVSHDDQFPTALPTAFDARYGLLSQLRVDGNFNRISCLARFADTPGVIGLVDPPLGDGYYFLAKEWGSPPGGGCFGQHYGDSSMVPDRRDALDNLAECP